MSPNVRLRMTVAEEMRLDPEQELFNDALHDKYITMHREALNQQQGALKTLLISDVGLALLLFGKNIKVPGTDFGIQDLPAANEVLTVVAAFGFLTLAMAFLNAQMYQAILEQFYIRRASKLGIDPDFIAFGNVFSQVYLKAFRPKMDIHGIDFFEPNRPYQAFYGLMVVLLLITWLSLLLLHLLLVAAGTWNGAGSSWFWWFFSGAIALIHIVGIAINLLPAFNFTVRMGRAEKADGRLSDNVG
ncbi:Hypothetical protein NGAL_HAMBI490_26190 [Neorhizobium galegae bv. officinalis]|nr:Hypothetical protein NGAL_HAMBI490_26190 [Neorhizobium galegae bv. officinalis]